MCQMVSQFNLSICAWFLVPLHNLNNMLSFSIWHCLLILLSSFSRCNVVMLDRFALSILPCKSYNNFSVYHPTSFPLYLLSYSKISFYFFGNYSDGEYERCSWSQASCSAYKSPHRVLGSISRSSHSWTHWSGLQNIHGTTGSKTKPNLEWGSLQVVVTLFFIF